jgi:hypothetical protein
MISANEPFLGAFWGSLVGGGVGWPFLKVDVAEFWIGGRPFWTTFGFDIEGAAAEDLLG